MFKLRRIDPIYGTYLEYTYEETVAVTDGFCDVQSSSTRDALLQRGFIEVAEEPPATPKGKWKTKGVEST